MSFNTKELVGKKVVLQTKKSGITFEGIFYWIFERNDNIVLKNWKEKKNGKIIDSGEIVILKKDAYITIKKFYDKNEKEN